MSTKTVSSLTEAQQLIYGRKRIVSALYLKDPELFQDLQPTDIVSIDTYGDFLRCTLQERSHVLVERSEVIKNFWEYRTRTPSFFDYKIWKSYVGAFGSHGVPVGALDYRNNPESLVLEPELGRVPRLAVDKDGTQKLYFVVEDQNACTCESWNQLHINRTALSEEFSNHSNIKFDVVCKHVQWLKSHLRFQALTFKSKQKTKDYNERLCVYYFDHRQGVVRYKITYDGLRSNGKWLPAFEWKERNVYTSAGVPTGACWTMFEKALDRDDPFKLVAYSQSLGALLNRTGSR